MRCEIREKRLLVVSDHARGTCGRPLSEPRSGSVADAASGVVLWRFSRRKESAVVNPLRIKVRDMAVGKEFIPARWRPQRAICGLVCLHTHPLAFHVVVLAKHPCMTVHAEERTFLEFFLFPDVCPEPLLANHRLSSINAQTTEISDRLSSPR